ncbi:F-box/kelch-repeat protein At1g23390-like [Salvia miltiorrhiza]|uniref:F-box/kelch-repeat protein At1g23390-like n=1 Tax=Salvia miltiorrhiza TaxID=226208 RepID=UPI0025AC0ECA|nr:F-box/kelch-repeat protein At1g23390-like [Salvia miltiorrhiza]
MAANTDQQTAVEDEDFRFHADVLESILSHVPLVDLVSASLVSKSWSDAVSSSLRHHNTPRPWLVLHAQARHPPYATAVHAYDPRSGIWIKIPQPPMDYIAGLKSSHSSFVYMFSPSRFSFSSDPLNLEWHHVEPPLVWRQDPIVARVGDSVVVAGGGCDFEDEPLAVEIYDLNTRSWRICDSMPGNIRDSAASSWLSIAVAAEKLIVADKVSGQTHCFDPETNSWSGPFDLLIGESGSISSYNIGCANNSLVLIALCRIKDVERVKIWRVTGDDFECEEIGEMPLEYVERLRSESSGECSINVRVGGSIMYVYNDTWDGEEVVACELVAGGGCRWWSVTNAVAREKTAERLVYTCAVVGIDELQRAMRAGNLRCDFE